MDERGLPHEDAMVCGRLPAHVRPSSSGAFETPELFVKRVYEQSGLDNQSHPAEMFLLQPLQVHVWSYQFSTVVINDIRLALRGLRVSLVREECASHQESPVDLVLISCEKITMSIRDCGVRNSQCLHLQSIFQNNSRANGAISGSCSMAGCICR